MKTMNNDLFKINCFIDNDMTKASVEQDAEGNERRYIVGVASGASVDRENERMSVSVLESFQKAIQDGIIDEHGEHTQVPLMNKHNTEWDDRLGYIVDAWLDDAFNLWIKAELDEDNPHADHLFKKLTKPPKKGRPLRLGMSVGGKVLQIAQTWDENIQKTVAEYRKVLLKEVSITTRPAYPTEYLSVLQKSIHWETTDDDKENTMSDVNDKNENLEKNEDATVEERLEGFSKTITDFQKKTETLEKSVEDLTTELQSQGDSIEEMVKLMKAIADKEKDSTVKTEAENSEVSKGLKDHQKEVDTFAKSMVETLGEIQKGIAAMNERMERIENEEVDKSLVVSKAVDGQNEEDDEEGSFIQKFNKFHTEQGSTPEQKLESAVQAWGHYLNKR